MVEIFLKSPNVRHVPLGIGKAFFDYAFCRTG